VVLFFVIDLASSAVILKGLNKFYGFDKKPEILINGSSMALAGFNKSAIENQIGKNVAIYAKEGVGLEDRYAMLKQFFSDNSNPVKKVIYELNTLLLSSKMTATNIYTIFYPYMDNHAIDNYIQSKATNTEYYIHKIFRSSRFDVLTINLGVKGYMGKYENFKSNAIDPGIEYFTKKDVGKVPVEMNEEKKRIFETTLQLIHQHEADVILVMMPIYYQKKATFDSVSFNKLDLYYRNLSGHGKNVSYLDLNSPDFTHNALIYSDILHLNREGQKKVTAAIVDFIK
jgi:hypothetical protein